MRLSMSSSGQESLQFESSESTLDYDDEEDMKEGDDSFQFDIFGGVSLIIPHFHNHRDMVHLPAVSNRYSGSYFENTHVEDMNHRTENPLELIDLYKDIKSAFDLNLNVNWKHSENEIDNFLFTESDAELQHKLNSFLPSPSLEHLSEYHHAFKTLHHDHIYQESPRLDGIHFVNITNDQFMKRDSKLQEFYNETADENQTKKIIVEPDQYEQHQQFHDAIQLFLNQNEEYCANPIIKGHSFDDVIDVVCIQPSHIDVEHHSALLNQKGLFAKMDISAYTVIGQYYGNEILSKVEDKSGNHIHSFEVYDKIYHETSAQMIHGRYSFDVKVDTADYNFSYVVDPLPLGVECDEDLKSIIFRKENMCKLIYINDCRKNIAKIERTTKDKKLQNVEYVQCNINGWGQIYMISIKRIKKGKQLLGYYKNELIKQIELEMEYEAMVEENSKIRDRLPLLKTLFK